METRETILSSASREGGTKTRGGGGGRGKRKTPGQPRVQNEPLIGTRRGAIAFRRRKGWDTRGVEKREGGEGDTRYKPETEELVAGADGEGRKTRGSKHGGLGSRIDPTTQSMHTHASLLAPDIGQQRASVHLSIARVSVTKKVRNFFSIVPAPSTARGSSFIVDGEKKKRLTCGSDFKKNNE